MYVVDGYNLLHALRKLHALPGNFGQARGRLLELLAHVGRRESRPVRVFFDGEPGELSPGQLDHPGLAVEFCGPGRESADHALRHYVSEHHEPRKLLVVSSDREVARVCRAAGARIMTSQDMAGVLAALVQRKGGAAESGLEKPSRGVVGRLEREMLDEIGDLREFERRILEGE
ncbi:MAG: NYN domain-containing protein [Planctomycetes bacterium]|nr:NYN domain-containing protein [Planctomycetota bacterium]